MDDTLSSPTHLNDNSLIQTQQGASSESPDSTIDNVPSRILQPPPYPAGLDVNAGDDLESNHAPATRIGATASNNSQANLDAPNGTAAGQPTV